MKTTKRAERRRNNARLFKKRFKEEIDTRCCWIGAPSQEDLDNNTKWAVWRARKRVHTNVMCSCSMCESPRRTYGNGKIGKTFAERRSLDSMTDTLEDIHGIVADN